mgnify:CR=1 FL=1
MKPLEWAAAETDVRQRRKHDRHEKAVVSKIYRTEVKEDGTREDSAHDADG